MDSTPDSPSPQGQQQPQTGHPPLPRYPGRPGYPQPADEPEPSHLARTGRRQAIASLVMGSLSVLCLLNTYSSLVVFLLGPVGVKLGFSSLAASRKSNSPGNGMAIAGLVCSGVSFLLVLVLMVFGAIMVGLFLWLSGQESSAAKIGELASII